MPVSQSYRPAPVYGDIGENFFDPVRSAAFLKHLIRFRNDRWAETVGLDALSDAEWVNYFGKFDPLPHNLPEPLAMRYHGHQFRTYNPDIGDGRGFLFAQMIDRQNRLMDLGTKGSGQTPYSRAGDGRLTLKGGVREVLITALLEALSVYTSKTFSLIETGEELYRQDEPSPTRSSVLVRLSHSHIRFGTFQRHAFENSLERLQRLVDYSIENYFQDLEDLNGDARVGAFLNRVCQNAAVVTASWMAAGFVHGVLNTDNMNITGESFDYGPYRMLPRYDPNFTAAYFDYNGLYCFGRQPEAVFWNLKQLAGALSAICDKDILVEALEAFAPAYEEGLRQKLIRKRLALTPVDKDRDLDFLNTLFAFLYESDVGYEQFFFDWFGGVQSEARAKESPEASKYQGAKWQEARAAMAAYEPCAEEAKRLSHTYFDNERPCTLLIDEIEAIWDQIADQDDWSAYEAKLAEIERMRLALNS